MATDLCKTADHCLNIPQLELQVLKHASKLVLESVGRGGGWTLGFPLYLSCLNGFQEVVLRMQDPSTGVPVRTVKTFMTKIPSVFTGKPNADVQIRWT